MSTVISSDQLRTLPLYNRNFLALGLLSISTHDVQAGSTLAGASFSISGQEPTANNFLLDGLNNVASSNNQAIPFQVNDAIQEFRVVYVNPDAQFGRETGGVVNIVTQRGTTNFHGSVFGFFGSDSLNANSPLSVYSNSGFAQAAAYAGAMNSTPPPAYQPFGQPIYQPATYNQYVATVKSLGTQNCTTPGATFGSPQCYQLFDPAAVLAGRDSHYQPFSSQQFGARAGGSFLKKWFWFGDYEGTRINNPNPIFERVPSAFDRSHLSQFTGTPGYQDALLAQKVLALYPRSNVVAVPGVLEFYQGQAPNYTNVDNYLARLDFNQSDNSTWSLRYNLQDLHQLHDDSLPGSTIYPGNGSYTSALNQNLAFTFTHQFSQNLANEARVGFTRFQVLETPQDQSFNASNIGLPSGPMPTFALSGLDPQYAGAQPGVMGGFGGWYDSFWASSLSRPYNQVSPSLDGLFPFARIGAPLGTASQRRDSAGQYVDNVSLTKGRHYLRMGGEFRNLQDIFIADGFSRGLVVSSDIGEFTSDSKTCNIPAGFPTSFCPRPAFSSPSFDYALRQPAPYRGLFNSYVAAGYIQDTWRVKSHLTVNLGLRYEFFSVPSEVNNQIWNYDPAANGLVQQNRTQVSDPFGFQCAANSYSQLESVYPANAALLPWRCAAAASGYNLKASKANFGPRIGIAWSNANATTVVRGGYGLFYDQLPVSSIAQLMFNRPTPANNSSPPAIYGQSFLSPYCGAMGQCGLGNTSLVSINPNESASQVASVPFGISAINAQQFQSPRSQQVNVSFEQQVTQKLSLELAYLGNFTSRLPAVANAGFNNEWFCTKSAGAPIPGEQAPATNCDSFSYLPIATLSDTAHGNYNALVFQVHTKGWHGVSANAAYSFSKALDNASEVNFSVIPTSLFTQIYALQFYGLANPSVFGIGNNSRFSANGNPVSSSAFPPSLNSLLNAGLTTTGQGQVFATPYTIPQDPTNYLNNDYGPSDLNLTNRLVIDFAWNLPWRQSSKLLGGWTVSGIFVAESGQPFTIFTGPLVSELTQRVDLTGPVSTTGNPNAYIGQTSSISLPSLACAAASPANSYYVQGQTLFSGTAGTPCPGSSGRNQFTGPAYADFDTALQKNIPLSERFNLVLRAEFYNLFNRANYYNPITSYSLNGVTTNPQFGEIQSAHAPRRIQLAVRLNW